MSFLAARAAPTGGFWVALAGGVAVARVAERRGARQGFGASIAAMLETVAIIGPARFGVPLTQAITAPYPGAPPRTRDQGARQFAACLALRLLHNTAATAFFIWVIAGGLDAYAGTYDALGRRLGFEVGHRRCPGAYRYRAAWRGRFATTVQVLVYRRGLHAWDELEAGTAPAGHVSEPRTRRRPPGRFDPRAVSLAAASRSCCCSRAPMARPRCRGCMAGGGLGGVRPDNSVLPTGLVFCAVLGGGALLFGLGGGLGLD